MCIRKISVCMRVYKKMEKGQKFEVFYQDDKTTRHKTLTYKSEQGSFLVFINERTNKEELIPSSRVIRMEGMKNATSQRR